MAMAVCSSRWRLLDGTGWRSRQAEAMEKGARTGRCSFCTSATVRLDECWKARELGLGLGGGIDGVCWRSDRYKREARKRDMCVLASLEEEGVRLRADSHGVGVLEHEKGTTSGGKYLMKSSPQRHLKDMKFSELEDYVEELGNERKRARQLWAWLYRDGYWAKHPSEMEGVSVKFRNLLDQHAHFDSLVLEEVKTGRDGTRKLAFRLKEDSAGGGVVETVLIPNGTGRHTVCVSSQLGCAMGCSFCFTAKMGLQKNLSVGQIVDQIVQVRRLFTAEVGPIKNIVFMGMGEPLHNLEVVLKALEIIGDPAGLACSPPRITVSTSGLVPEIRTFCRESSASLAVSLNATTDEVRSAIMPINKRYDIATLLGALREEFPRTKQQDHVLLEYIMLAGINDSLEDAQRLLGLTEGLPCKINLIVFNAHEGTPFQPSSPEQLVKFKEALIAGGRLVFVRQSRGDDEMAACGQLGRPMSGWKPPQALSL